MGQLEVDKWWVAVAGELFTEPEVLRSTGGLLEVRLEAALGKHEVAGREATTLGYNGGVPGPTLRLRPGIYAF